jgi:phosphoribosylformylglycinamidine synthase
MRRYKQRLHQENPMQHTGGLALSKFRSDKILQTAMADVPYLTALIPHHIHFIALEGELSTAEQARLEHLLTYPAAAEEEIFPSAAYACQVLVIPRPGTLSPWSSKATEIARNCDLSAVKRIERGVMWTIFSAEPLEKKDMAALLPYLHDRMTEMVLENVRNAEDLLFTQAPARQQTTINVMENGRLALESANRQMGLALSDEEITYLLKQFTTLKRDPSDTELMMFAQANSEHCRHKIFNANWVIDRQVQSTSLFNMIRNTHVRNPGKVLLAYLDNAAVLRGFDGLWFAPNEDQVYQAITEERHILMKVETHNHPTAISPFPGAATGSGGEIRDEGATGRGSKAKASLTGFSVSNLRIPGAIRAWEEPDYGTPARLASALQIMLEGPIGASAFNNEFGRPNLCGYFRTFELNVAGARRGYHKPIMLAGGVGHVRPSHIQKRTLPVGAKIVVLGGPAMLIGLGGGAASSMSAGHSDEELDFASVQRGNPEIQRRCQEVIDACTRLGMKNPVYAIHDVGAGGLSNAIPELLHDCGRGGRVALRDIPSADPALSPMELWCNEAQERYVLGLDPDAVALFTQICARERCPFAIVGEVTQERHLVLHDSLYHKNPIDAPMSLFFGSPPKILRNVRRVVLEHPPFHPSLENYDLVDVALRVLHLPTVANKKFLITIGDRSITGLVVRDQMVGPWQVPVADCAVTATDFYHHTGEAMALGERAPLALLSAPASARMAVAEALTNLAAAAVDDLSDVVLSANWMAACGHPGEDAALFEAVKAVGIELCPALGIAIPVGKDSLSMKTVWDAPDNKGKKTQKAVTSPLSVIISAFARVSDVRRTRTPQLQKIPDTVLILIDLGRRKNRLGGSALAQVHALLGNQSPDLERAEDLKSFFNAIQALNAAGKLLAYHDRSDGGLFVTLAEMAFAGRCGLDIALDTLGTDVLAALFNEELGAVLQVQRKDIDEVMIYFVGHTSLSGYVHVIGQPTDNDILTFTHNKHILMAMPRSELERAWSETTYHIQRLRDNPDCAKEEYDALLDNDDPGLQLHAPFVPQAPPLVGTRPHVAILREQGVNGQIEMAAAFDRAGFTCVDVHMSDILAGRVSLADFQGMAACGGFSYGDVLGAGGGWAKSILFHNRSRDEFSAFFQRQDTFTLGVCNGCQMLAQLHELIPGSDYWPRFVRNRSEQFEARLVMVEIPLSPSLLLQGMNGARLPIVVAHGEGLAQFNNLSLAHTVTEQQHVALRYIDNRGRVTQAYPFNPNGSPLGITGLTSSDGRVTIMMPHPERVFLSRQFSWLDPRWTLEDSPWMQLFYNARRLF